MGSSITPKVDLKKPNFAMRWQKKWCALFTKLSVFSSFKEITGRHAHQQVWRVRNMQPLVLNTEGGGGDSTYPKSAQVIASIPKAHLGPGGSFTGLGIEKDKDTPVLLLPGHHPLGHHLQLRYLPQLCRRTTSLIYELNLNRVTSF